MTRFRDFVLHPGTRSEYTVFNRSAVLLGAAIRGQLRDQAVEAPWGKLVIRLDSLPAASSCFKFPVDGVMVADLAIDLERLRDLTPATGTQLAAALTHDALALLRTTVDWDETAFRAIVDAVAAHRGPFIRYPASLSVERRSGSYRIAYEMDEAGVRVLLEHRPKGEEAWRRTLVRDFPAAWGFPIDYEPRKLRVGPAGIDLLNPRGRVLDTVPTDDLQSERWTTLPSGT